MATTKSYHHYLIESLKDPNEAAAYLWAVLQEENPEPELLKSALEDILEAYAPQLRRFLYLCGTANSLPDKLSSLKNVPNQAFIRRISRSQTTTISMAGTIAELFGY
ncbi:MAG: DNA-binding protein [Microcystaceae cyanobacterium]